MADGKLRDRIAWRLANLALRIGSVQYRAKLQHVFARGLLERDSSCWCSRCDEAKRRAQFDVDGDFGAYISRFMILCPDCGDKRCPKADFHGNPCDREAQP